MTLRSSQWSTREASLPIGNLSSSSRSHSRRARAKSRLSWARGTESSKKSIQTREDFVARVAPTDDGEVEALQRFHFKYVAPTELDRVREGATFVWTQEKSEHGLLNRLHFDVMPRRRPGPSRDGKTFAKKADSGGMPEIK